jgi:SAM-dependent methyltransferase
VTTNVENYLKNLRLEQLFKELKASNPEALARTVQHFTTNEAEDRDKIVINYFGEPAISKMVDDITRSLLEPPEPPPYARILDVGAGSGFFTIKIAEHTRADLPNASFYAMDLTPAMLLSLAKKKADITPFIGTAENVAGSIRQARKSLQIPLKFDAVFSTLMLHHSTQPEKVFESLRTALKKNGKAVLVDLCEHSFEEFRADMGDVHLGFKPERIREIASRYFQSVRVEKMPGIRCKSSGRSAEIFVAALNGRL